MDLESIHRAGRLAFYLHHNKLVALRILTAALESLDAAAAKQRRRTFYKPKRLRSKVAMNRNQLLQGLVYLESERFEKSQEKATERAPDDEDLLVRYIKHLVHISAQRNAFHVTVALCRLLYRYDTRETMMIYDFLTQDPECRFESPYYRSRKRILMHEIHERFGSQLEICHGPRGEDRFCSREAEPEEVSVVEKSLDRFVPWKTCCVFHGAIDAYTEIPQLRSTGLEPDEVHRVEMQRIHSILHPPCFDKLTRALGLPPPAERLRIPVFKALPGDFAQVWASKGAHRSNNQVT